MSQINWITPSGTIGTIAENEYFQFQLDAVTSPSSNPLTYKIIAGLLTPGLQLSGNGLVHGIPLIENALISQDTFTQTFTIRCSNSTGQIADRTFSVTVNPIALPQILPRNVSLGSYYSGYYLDLQLEAIDPNPLQPLVWTLLSGELPNGTVLSSSGRITGFIQPFIASPTTASLGWSESGWDNISWDATSAIAIAHTYYFTVQVFDGSRTDETTYNIYAKEKNTLTSDSTLVTIDTTHTTVDLTGLSLPFLTTLPQALPTQRQLSNFAFQFQGEDLDGNVLNYSLSVPPISATAMVASSEYKIAFIGTTDFTLYGATSNSVGETFIATGPGTGTGTVVNTSIDPATTVPTGLSLDPATGWLIGTIGTQIEVQKTYTFQVYCYVYTGATDWDSLATYNLDDTVWYNYVLYIVNGTTSPGDTPFNSSYFDPYPLVSSPVTFTLTVLNDLNNTITWLTPEDLGFIDNGAISELSVSAVSALGKSLNYSFTSGYYNRLPQGLILLPNGLITGRASFEFFSLDNGTTTFDSGTTNFDNLYTFTVTASDGSVSGDYIDATALVVGKDYQIINPGTTDFTLVGASSNVTGTIFTATDPGTGNGVVSMMPTVSSYMTFIVRVNNFNRSPYQNLYLAALASKEQRIAFSELLSNTSIFPDQLIYRESDPWFGKATDIKFLFAAGLSPTLVENYIAVMEHNHYRKPLNLGGVKTAVALDASFNIKYEVVYIEVLDPETNNGLSPPQSINRINQVSPPYNVPPFTVVYPNALNNMFTDIATVGFANQGALPDWMLDPQPNGGVLGFTRGVVLAYTVPGASNLIANRIQQNNITFNNVNFVADRYELDRYLTENYNVITGKFNVSKDTTFDNGTTTFDGGTTVITDITVETTFDLNTTTFDLGATKFYDNRDSYALPEQGTVYLKFTQNGIYQ